MWERSVEAQGRDQIFNAHFFVSQKLNAWRFRLRFWSVSHRDKKMLKRMLAEIRDLYEKAAKVLAEAGDDRGAAHCYYNMALAYRGAWKYRMAKKYLMRAEKIAQKYDIKQILHGISEIRKDLKQKDVSGEDVDYGDFLKA